jgi:protein O-mannosyl-transferase
MVLREQPPATNREPWLPGWPVVCLLLAATTLAVWWPAVRCDFLNYDDPEYFTANPQVQTGLTWTNAVWAFTTGHASNWHPLVWLSLMLDVECFGKGPFGPHFTNLLFHTANTVLLFLLLRRLTATTWRSALVGAFFTFHPVHVESVAWVSERKDVLSAFFGLLSLLCYTHYAQHRPGVEDRKSKAIPALDPRFLLAWFSFALGLMSKPMLVTLPLVMLLLDYWPLARVPGGPGRLTSARLVLEKAPFLVLSAVSCVVTFVVQQKGGAVATLVKIPLAGRIENAFVAYARYLDKTFWPATLATPYPLPGQWPVGQVLLAVALFAGLCGIALVLRKRFPFVFTGWFWFVIMLVPVIGLVQVGNAAMADRYTYLPLIGVFIVLVWGLGKAVAIWRLPQPVATVLALSLLLAGAWRTRIQIGYWHDSSALFTHTLAVTENNYVAENDLGTWLSKNGQVREAMDHFRRSLQIEPANADALFNLGNAYVKMGDWDEAIANYRLSLKVAPAQADLLSNLGLALASKRQYAEAVTNFEAALKLKPDSAETHNNLAAILFMEHRFDEAAQHYREALRLTPDDPRIYANLGDTLARLNQIPEAVKCYQEALRLNPGDNSISARLQELRAAMPK